ncbi:MAG TPA: hypothetical protein VFU65_16015 [Actinocrinis sp.]|nr:hypothetical protein [Actinocrinis sp.]
MTATTPLLASGLQEPGLDSDSAGTIIVGLALLALGLGMIILKDDRRSRLGGALLMLWGGILFVPSVLAL